MELSPYKVAFFIKKGYYYGMYNRSQKIDLENSFFLFGARGTGKSTLLKEMFANSKCHFFDLLDPDTEERLSKNPEELNSQLNAFEKQKVEWIVFDEIQKIPKLLDLIHKWIENSSLKFALTGSSGRKLKRGASNLLAGRAFVYQLYPLTHLELGNDFDLLSVLRWGSLPRIFSYKSEKSKAKYLRAYTHTYLKEEIISEQIIRNLDPFREFLEVAAQSNSKIINYTKIARDVGADVKTVQNYFKILEDTLIGYMLPPFNQSFRKRQSGNPKFYFFDTGIKRALERRLNLPMTEKTYEFGEVFEHFIISEIIRLNDYLELDWKFSYLRTSNGAEIDLIIDRPGRRKAVIEIKSKELVDGSDISTLNRFKKDGFEGDYFCLSRDPNEKIMKGIHCLHWKQGLEYLF
ncbi:MAG: ATP-binding protein [Fibrobacteria bacterium]|nr:ATP-binding protein [Fibrobacteria bacterium]